MDAPTGHDQNADQIAYWNGPAGQRWAQRQAAQDIVLGPVADLVIDRAKLKPGERVIDVGCGSGATAIAFAREVAPTGHVLGVDISSPCSTGRGRARPRTCLSISCWPTPPSIRSIRPRSICWPRALA